VRGWISQPPSWLEVVKQPVDSALAHLNEGEREAISLASELQAVLLLMDERDGVENGKNVGMAQPRCRLCVLLKAAQSLRIERNEPGQRLDSHIAL